MSPYITNLTAKEGVETIPSANPVLTVAANYVTGDYVGTSGVAMVFNNCAAQNGGGGYILGAELVDAALQSIAAELWIFDTAVTPPADSAAWTISDAHAASCLAVIPFSTYYASAANSVSHGSPDAPRRYVCAAGSRALYGCIVTRGSPAYASLDLTVRLSLVQD